jgi:hypothetical protein
MTHFSIAHVLRLRDGMFAVRSAEFPSCEGQDSQMWSAREQYRQALSERVREMIRNGETPSLCVSVAEAEASLAEHCKMQLPAEDRLPKTYDYAVIVDLELAPDDAERFAVARSRKLLPEPQM